MIETLAEAEVEVVVVEPARYIQFALYTQFAFVLYSLAEAVLS